MASNPTQLRRIPTEQFFDLRNWSADNAEDYGGKASMVVHTMLLSKPEQVNQITTELDRKSVV